ncbi:MAG: amidohydrolase family protein, partial [Firmicutes bacterium]|nr:amidohydrolase family protein [Bacillota bacterium]
IPSESEWKQVERDLSLAKETGCAYHICHVSCAETVELVRNAKADGVDVTCEVTPHNLLLNDMMLEENGRFKMNPPLRSESDRLALLNGIKDGTIDMIITDHAPHSAEEKAGGLEKSLFGIVGLETVFPLLYTYLVKEGVINLDRLLVMMTTAPRKRFGITADPGITVWNLEEEYAINPDDFLSMGRATPFVGRKVFGRCMATVYDGKAVYEYK